MANVVGAIRVTYRRTLRIDVISSRQRSTKKGKTHQLTKSQLNYKTQKKVSLKLHGPA